MGFSQFYTIPVINFLLLNYHSFSEESPGKTDKITATEYRSQQQNFEMKEKLGTSQTRARSFSASIPRGSAVLNPIRETLGSDPSAVSLKCCLRVTASSHRHHSVDRNGGADDMGNCPGRVAPC